MAYVSRQTGSSRATSIIAVGAIHAAIGAALIYGFAPDLVKIIKPGHTVAFTVPPKQTPPPPQEKSKPAGDSMITAPSRPIELIQPLPLPPPVEVPVDETSLTIKLPPAADPTGKPTPAFEARSPVPANNVSSWATNNDFPLAALRREEQGVSGFRVAVGSDGKVKSCEITQTSGSATLDAATCKLVTRRARFEPAINDRGEKVVGMYSSAIRWQLPD